MSKPNGFATRRWRPSASWATSMTLQGDDVFLDALPECDRGRDGNVDWETR